MAMNSTRKVKVSCGSRDFFSYVTDIRNFGRFVPVSMKEGWMAENDSCRFILPGMGEIKLSILRKEPFTDVLYSGNALSRINFSLDLKIEDKDNDTSEVELQLKAEADPLTMIVASPGIERFLDMLAGEMEKFKDWK